MTLMSPRRMFQSCGSSSIDVRRRTRPTRVILRIALVDGVAGAELLRADDHRPELEHLEVLAVPADARLPVENRPAALELRRERGEPEERAREHETDACDDDVDGAVHLVPFALSHVCGVPERR